MTNSLSLEKASPQKQWSQKEIRKVLFGSPNQSLTYRLAGEYSLRIIPAFLRWNIAPNTITFLHVGCLILASIVLAFNPRDGVQIVAFLITSSYILDSADGPVARISGRTSSIGDKLDLFGHWLTNNLLILGATVGEVSVGGGYSVWLMGMIAMMGTNIYYYMQHNLLPHSPLASNKVATNDEEADKSQLRSSPSIFKRVRTLLHEFYPLDTNLIIFASLIGWPFLSIYIWAVISNVATFVIFGQYFWRETR